jgi:hypothetical protein
MRASRLLGDNVIVVLVIVVSPIRQLDLLLCELKPGEEDGVGEKGSSHAHAETTIPLVAKVVNVGSGGNLFVAEVAQCILLVDRLAAVNWVDEDP